MLSTIHVNDPWSNDNPVTQLELNLHYYVDVDHKWIPEKVHSRSIEIIDENKDNADFRLDISAEYMSTAIRTSDIAVVKFILHECPALSKKTLEDHLVSSDFNGNDSSVQVLLLKKIEAITVQEDIWIKKMNTDMYNVWREESVRARCVVAMPRIAMILASYVSTSS